MVRSRTTHFVVALLLAACGSSEGPDLILHNAKVFTASNETEWAEALAVAGARIVEVGSSEATLATAGPRTRVVDVRGRVIVPGFNDAHYHPVFYRIDRELIQFGNGPPDPSLDEVMDSLRSATARTPAGMWIWVPVKGEVFADPRAGRSGLDEVAPDHPVVLQGWAGHGRILNTPAERELEPLLAAEARAHSPGERVRRHPIRYTRTPAERRSRQSSPTRRRLASNPSATVRGP